MRDSFISACRVALLALLALLTLAACEARPVPTPTPAPVPGAVLQKILNDCWGVTQIKDLDGNRADHVKAFECARGRLLQMAQVYPGVAETHRVLAWGYLYSLKDEGIALAEYERAAEIYASQGDAADQADILVRIAVQLTMPHDTRGGCNLLQQAAGVDPQNARIPVLLQNFNCVPRATIPSGPAPASTPSGASASGRAGGTP